MAISNLWQKYPNTRCALAHCEHLLSEFNKGKFEPTSSVPNPDQSSVTNRLDIFQKRYSRKVLYLDLSSVTFHYRLRGGLRSVVTAVFLAINACYYGCSPRWTTCYLESVTFVTEQRYFQCSRSTKGYFNIVTISFFVFLPCHFLLLGRSFLWALSSPRKGSPLFKRDDLRRNKSVGQVLKLDGDAAFLFHIMNVLSNTLLFRRRHRTGKELKGAK